MESIQAKTCTKCGQTFPATIDHFRRQKRGKYGVTSRCKLCEAAYHADLYKRDPRIRKRNLARHRGAPLPPKERVAKTQEQITAKRKAWRAAYNPRERELATLARPRRVSQQVAYRAANSEKIKTTRRIWNEKNLERRRASVRNRRARKKAAPGTHTAADVQRQFQSQQGKCYWCAQQLGEYHVDHIVALTKGGSNGPENLCCACPSCNLRKHNKMPWEFAGRLL